MEMNGKKKEEFALCETESNILMIRCVIRLVSAVIVQYGPFLTQISRLIRDPVFP
jgi:hypothetical protein